MGYGGYGGANPGYGSPAGAAYGNPNVPNAGYANGPPGATRSSWVTQTPSGYGAVSYGNAGAWGAAGPVGGGPVSGPVGQSPGGGSGYGNQGYGYGGDGSYGSQGGFGNVGRSAGSGQGGNAFGGGAGVEMQGNSGGYMGSGYGDVTGQSGYGSEAWRSDPSQASGNYGTPQASGTHGAQAGYGGGYGGTHTRQAQQQCILLIWPWNCFGHEVCSGTGEMLDSKVQRGVFINMLWSLSWNCSDETMNFWDWAIISVGMASKSIRAVLERQREAEEAETLTVRYGVCRVGYDLVPVSVLASFEAIIGGCLWVRLKSAPSADAGFCQVRSAILSAAAVPNEMLVGLVHSWLSTVYSASIAPRALKEAVYAGTRCEETVDAWRPRKMNAVGRRYVCQMSWRINRGGDRRAARRNDLLWKASHCPRAFFSFSSCVATSMEMSSSSSGSESSSEEAEIETHTSGIPGVTAAGAAAAEGCHSKATVVGPLRFSRAPPGFEREEMSASSQNCRSKRTNPLLHQVVRAVEGIEARV
ncbi:hypothetical protein Nepgr_020727 [Nepenthes gracilis]|uniref:Uncharacterized protein n=1 Tax=Nepenthes gracilis TaxID=150966 RepID=A0AAD3XWN6_NEPGR|nr:hypothetical protein Nepgr_020727 [Nepenthes gracilis]